MNEQELKSKKLEELRESYLKQQEASEKEAEAQTQAKTMLKKFVDEKGIQRLSNVALVNKDLYFKAASAIMQLVQKGYVREKIPDEQVKQILSQLKPDKDFTIRRK